MRRDLATGGPGMIAWVASLACGFAELTACHPNLARHAPAPPVRPNPPAVASAASQAPAPPAALDAEGNVKVDVFATASQHRWTAIRNPNGARLANVRLSAKGDAALVTWEEFGQFWCGLAIPESECKGGRWFDIVGRPGVLPERFARSIPGDSEAPIHIAADHRAPIAAKGMDMTLGAYVRGGADIIVSPHVHDFEFSVDYEKDPAFQRAVRRCRTLTVQVPGRAFTFACEGLRAAEASN